MKKEKSIIVTAAVIENDGKILIGKRKGGIDVEGKWEFPGGKVESGETPEECLKRELFEEFGIETRIGELLCTSSYTYSHGTVILLTYRAYHVSGEFNPTDHDDIRWVAPHELDSFEFAPADIPILKRIKEIFC